MVLHQWIAGIGGFLLIAELGWGVPAAIAAALIMALNGYMFSLQANFTLIDSIAWLPLCLWSLHKIGICQRNVLICLYLTLAVICVALTLLAGRPEVSAPVMVLITGYVVLSATPARNIRITLLRASAILCGVLLAMPAILPALEWAALSTRAHGLSNQDVFTWSANWYDFLNMVLAQPLGNLNLRGAQFLCVATPRANYIPFIASCYVGPAAITLATWGLLDSRFKLRPYAVIVLIVGVLMALGSYTPIAPLIVSLFHSLAVFRYPEKLLVFVLLSISFLTARGLSISLKKDALSSSSLVFSLGLWSVWLIIMGILTLPYASSYLSQIIVQWHGSTAPCSTLSEAITLIGKDGLAAGAIGLVVCIITWLRRLNKVPSYLPGVVIIGALSTNLLTASCASSRMGTEPEFFSHKSILESTLKGLGFNGTGHVLSLFFDPVTYPAAYPGFAGEDTTARFYQYGRQLLLPNTNVDASIASSYGYEASQTSKFRTLFLSAYNISHACTSLKDARPPDHFNDRPLANFCQITSTQFAVSQLYKLAPDKQYLPTLDLRWFKIVYQSDPLNVRIYKVLSPMPRVYFADSWKAVDSGNHDIQTSASTQIMQDNSNVRFVIDYPEELVLSTRSSLHKLLVINDQYYPGWKATIDCVPAEILRVNTAFRGTSVPPGEHTVRFTYEPESLKVGLWLAGSGVLIWLAILGSMPYYGGVPSTNVCPRSSAG